MGKPDLKAIKEQREIPIILETPIDDDRDDFENIKIAKGYA